MVANRLAVLLLSGLGLAVAACGSSGGERDRYVASDDDRLPKGTGTCIFSRSISSWNAIDDYNLIVYAPGQNHPYLIELNSRCSGLAFDEELVFDAGVDGRLCEYGGDAILLRDPVERRCTIGSIRPYDPDVNGADIR